MEGRLTLLVDGDVEAFRAASVCQGGGVADPAGAERRMAAALERYRRELGAEEVVVCLGSPDNWRKELWTGYKANRRGRARPILLDHCRRFLANAYRTEMWPRLEADDVMGMLSHSIENSVVVSIDKDMKSVPCRLYNPGRPAAGVVPVGELEAFRNHMMQTLVGDASDGYKGCPGVGVKKAAALIDPLLPRAHSEIARTLGRRNVWKAVMRTFAQKGLSPYAAVRNARLAYILRDPGDYDRESGEVRLWRFPT